MTGHGGRGRPLPRPAGRRAALALAGALVLAGTVWLLRQGGGPGAGPGETGGRSSAGRTVPAGGAAGVGGRSAPRPYPGGDATSSGAPIPGREAAPTLAPEATAEGADLVTIPRDGRPLARVEGSPLSLAQIFPPGAASPGDQFPRATLLRFIQDAVDRRVLVLEAERRGYADEGDFLRLMSELRQDVAELPHLTPAEREWQLNEMREMALADRLYREEGIVRRRVEPGTVEDYYRSHSAEYDWVRKREALKGASPEKIERRVKEEMRRDLEAPAKREARRQREELAARYRGSYQVEILP